MGVAAISLPSIIFMFPGASIAMLHQRWDDWVARDATVTTRKDQSEDTAGVTFELLRTRMVLRPALTPLVGDRRTPAGAGAIRAGQTDIQAVQSVAASAGVRGCPFR